MKRKTGRPDLKEKKPAFVVSSLILKGGAGKTFTVYMLVEYIKEKLHQRFSQTAKRLDKVLVCDMDSQISLIGNFEGFTPDRRTNFYLDEKHLGEKIKVKHKAPTENEFESYDLIIIDNPPEYQVVLDNEEMIVATDLFIVPVNQVNALDRVEDTIFTIREKEEKYKKEKPAEIVLLFIDTMYVHTEVNHGIIRVLKGIAKRNREVNYWGNIPHSKKVSYAQINRV